jgi:hypothetical protein
VPTFRPVLVRLEGRVLPGETLGTLIVSAGLLPGQVGLADLPGEQVTAPCATSRNGCQFESGNR